MAILVYLAYALAVLFPVWSRSVDPIWDARDYFLPSFAFMADALREGTVPLWDPFTNCGFPFHADPQAPLLNPIALAAGVLIQDVNAAFAAYWTFHWIWAGLGMFVLAAALGACPIGGIVAAISFSMSGFFVDTPSTRRTSSRQAGSRGCLGSRIAPFRDATAAWRSSRVWRSVCRRSAGIRASWPTRRCSSRRGSG